MKIFHLLKGLYFVSLLLPAANGSAQNKISFDLAAIHNMRSPVTGLNVSGFYHFNEQFIGGMEMNRFFPVNSKAGDEDIKLSAWDFELNFHYLLPLYKNYKFYPVTGISHTSEKEFNPANAENQYKRFWSFNTGAGILCECGKWLPHIEYSFAWGQLNQQFLLAGISYELEWSRHNKVAHL